jgi:hypothetical protein
VAVQSRPSSPGEPRESRKRSRVQSDNDNSRHGPATRNDISVTVADSVRVVQGVSVHARLGAGFVNDMISPRRVRKKDYCRLCKVDRCDHCFYPPGEEEEEEGEEEERDH